MWSESDEKEYINGYNKLTSKNTSLVIELMVLNPALRNKDSSEFVSLLNAIGECGYEWDDDRKCFYNNEINNEIKTQGLNLFTGKKFFEKHSFWEERNQDPAFLEFQKAARKAKIMISGIIFFGLFGWIIMPIVTWFVILVIFCIGYLFIESTYLQRKRNQRDRALKKILKKVREEYPEAEENRIVEIRRDKTKHTLLEKEKKERIIEGKISKMQQKKESGEFDQALMAEFDKFLDKGASAQEIFEVYKLTVLDEEPLNSVQRKTLELRAKKHLGILDEQDQEALDALNKLIKAV